MSVDATPAVIAALALCLGLLCISGCMSAAAQAQTVTPPMLPVTGASLLASDGQLLWSENGYGHLAIASTTKLMTFLVVMQHEHNLHLVLTQNDWVPAADDSQIGLQPGEQMTVLSLLYAMMLPSADDAAEDLAYNFGGGSVRRFVAWMNADARRLGLAATHYSTPIGLDTPGNYSSPDDLVRLASYLVHRYRIFRRIVDTYSLTVWNVGHTQPFHLVNTDDLIARYRWIVGVKTGHTTDAGYVLVSEGARDHLTLFASVLGTTSQGERDQSALTLLDWGFKNFHETTPVRRGEVFARRLVAYESRPARIVAARSFRTVLPRTVKVRIVVGHLRKLLPPMRAHTAVGYVQVEVSGHRVARVRLLLQRALPSVPEIKKIMHKLTRPTTLLLLVVLVSVGSLVTGIRRRRRHLRRQRERRAGRRAERQWEQ
ncbi:MAG: D-alanyl-D-alanine carboxypeptidase family protein [Solirubrobacteraceae bacterium]